jgi:hypothetical protein
MLSFIPKSVQWFLGLIVVAALSFGLWEWTTSMGRDRLIDVAMIQNLCRSTECAEGISEVSTLLGAKYNVSPSLVQWCVGVDRWAGTRARKVEWLKAIVVSGMRLPCPSMSEGQR